MTDLLTYKKDEGFPQNAAVACQGAPGAYSQLAAGALFSDPSIMYLRTFDGVFRAVQNGLCRYGILPVENSNAGSVGEVYDLMKAYRFYIVRGAKISVSHRLLGNAGTKMSDVREIYTHDQAFRQCSRFLEQNEGIKVNRCQNTAAAARYVAESGRTDIAAIASSACETLYGLAVLNKSVQNYERNFTRFICISKECEIYENADKITLMLTLEHKHGALVELLKSVADAGMNLTKLESRPIADTDFEFMFYFDFEANILNKKVSDLLTSIEKSAKSFTFLGNYGEITG
jgi:chorismate mutase/prephenate dehydratase